jgi:AcrR family transcriptional regulator
MGMGIPTTEAELVGPRSSSQRRDSQASRRRLLDAVGRLLADGDGPRSLQHVASEAGLSVATAYRHFASLDSALQAYAHHTVLSMGEFARTQSTTGLALLESLSYKWVRLTRERGPAMVHLRSRRGFLERRSAGERIIADTCSYLEPAMLGVLAEEGLPADALEVALFLWNVLFDPREILDLLGTLEWDEAQLVNRLLAGFRASLVGVAASGASPE